MSPSLADSADEADLSPSAPDVEPEASASPKPGSSKKGKATSEKNPVISPSENGEEEDEDEEEGGDAADNLFVSEKTPNHVLEEDVRERSCEMCSQTSASGAVDDDDEEQADDVYIVQKIINHAFDSQDGVIKFHVRWQGYPKAKDHTWEPESNLATASEILDEYIEKVGGREALMKVPLPKKRGRPSLNRAKSTPTRERSTKRAKKMEEAEEVKQEKVKQEESPEKKSRTPPGNWEDLVDHIDTMNRQENGLFVQLTFKDGYKIRQLASVVYKRCPQKMLEFYESHLSFTPINRPSDDTNEEV